MADKTNLLWSDATWNVVTGCTKKSPACKNCYAERDWENLAKKEGSVYFGRRFTDVQCHPERLDMPMRWTRARKIFVNSTSDLFHEDVPTAFIDQVFAVMGLAKAKGLGHVFQLLTKRAERMYAYLADPETPVRVGALMAAQAKAYRVAPETEVTWPLPNAWVGVTVENQETAAERLPYLLTAPAAVRWVSAEPLLGEVDFSLALTARVVDGVSVAALDWVVCGGESGDKARPLDSRWVRKLRDQCRAAGVPFLFKQWGTWAPARYAELPSRKGVLVWNLEDPALAIADWGEPIDFGDGYGAVYAGRLDTGRLLDGELLEAYPDVAMA